MNTDLIWLLLALGAIGLTGYITLLKGLTDFFNNWERKK